MRRAAAVVSLLLVLLGVCSAGCGAARVASRVRVGATQSQQPDPSEFPDQFNADIGRSTNKPTFILPRGPFRDPFTGEVDPALDFNPYNPYRVPRHVEEPPGQGRSYLGPIQAVAPGAPEQLGLPVVATQARPRG